MTISANTICGCHLVGSVPLQNSEAVFDLSHRVLGRHLRRLPDGETGERSHWIKWQFAVFADTPQLDIIQQPPDSYGFVASHYALKSPFSATDITFGELGYSAAALASYAVFSARKSRGELAPDCRFQVSLPTPIAPIQFYIAAEDRHAIEPVYESKLMQELQIIIDNIPHHELAIQWDTAVEFGILEGVFPTYLTNPKADILERLSRLGNAVPESVELGYHLCYGDSGHKHFVEPDDTALLVSVANGIARQLQRPLNWLHLPVPVDRDDHRYFAPLAELDPGPACELYLGLIHASDGVDGTRRRIEAAQSVVTSFGIATECGFGRRAADSISDLMAIHAEVASPIR